MSDAMSGIEDDYEQEQLGRALIERAAARFVLDKGEELAGIIARRRIAHYQANSEDAARGLWLAVLEAIDRKTYSARIH